MSHVIAWIAAEAERPGGGETWRRRREASLGERDLPAHQFPARQGAPGTTRDVEENPHFSQEEGEVGHSEAEEDSHPPAKGAGRVGQPNAELGQLGESFVEDDRERRAYRGRTIAMLRRYMRYSIETGRLPSLLGKEFFRAKVTAYTVVSFEDRVIFVHDMETCLGRLDEFSRQLIARHILQEHDQPETARILQCSVRTVRSYVPVALDLLSEILLEVGLMRRSDLIAGNSCQEGRASPISVSEWEDGK